jgi:hypothetical protein
METGVDLILEWCSVRTTGNRDQFDRACQSTLGDALKPSELLRRLEILGHLEVDWATTGRWWTTPTVLNLAEGSGGNAAITGARTRATRTVLAREISSGTLASFASVDQGPGWPSAWFVGIASVTALAAAAEALSAVATNQAPYDYLKHLRDLITVLASAETAFPPSGIRAEELARDDSLRFVPCEVRYAQWPPGCFRQRSRGIDHYLFVDDDGTAHVTDRWVATHAELDRRRRNNLHAPTPVAWDPDTSRLSVWRNAQLPTAWARAAVLSTGLAPARIRLSNGQLIDRFEGVDVNTYREIVDSLRIPHQSFDSR